MRVSLDLQDRTVEALRTCVVDDIHLSHAIARLLELLTTNIRTRFLRFAPLDRTGDGDGDGHDRTSAPASRVHSPRPRDGPVARRDGLNSHAWAPAASQLGYTDTHPPSTTPLTSVHDPLAGIPAQPINSSNINVNFMPPPPSVYSNFYEPRSTPPANDIDSALPSQSMNENQAQTQTQTQNQSGVSDWFALPLDQFFNSATAVVDQGLGGTGPMVGELDMLEVLLNEQYDGTGTGNDGLDSGGGLSSQFMQ